MRIAFKRLKPLLLALLVVILSFLVSPASAGHVKCEFDMASHTVTITGYTGDPQISVFRVGNEIREQFMDCGNATRFNTDKIVINDAPSHDLVVFILMAEGPFAPGFTNESGDSDEIEFEVHLGDGSNTVIARGGSKPDKFVGGTTATAVNLNLNAAETSHVDADVTIDGSADTTSLQGQGGKDTLRANGGAGTGGKAELRFEFSGGPRSDLLIGGFANDSGYGFRGADRIRLGPGEDEADGASGDDRIFGGSQNDLLTGANGNDFLDGGAGTDTCVGGSGTNQLENCES